MNQKVRTKLANWQRWERQVHEERLLATHSLYLKQKNQQDIRAKKLKRIEQDLLQGIKRNWKYIKKSPPPEIELAWIIYSQIGWKSPNLDLEEEELWEDLPEIDPLEIILCCQEALDPTLKDNRPDTLIEQETLFELENILNQLAQKGIDIREERYSQNWIRNKKRHRTGRLQEIKAREKNTLEKMRENSQKSSSLIKKTIDKKGKKQKVIPQKKSIKSPVKILASFFGLA